VEDSPHDENHALALHTKKGGINKRNFRKTFKDEKNSGYQRKDMSKVQCFRCDKYGHIARNCPTRKRERQYDSTADMDPDPPQKDEDMRNEDLFL
jgi:hypothetical protein